MKYKRLLQQDEVYTNLKKRRERWERPLSTIEWQRLNMMMIMMERGRLRGDLIKDFNGDFNGWRRTD